MIIKVIGLGEDSDQDMLAPDSLPPSTPDFLGKVGFWKNENKEKEAGKGPFKKHFW